MARALQEPRPCYKPAPRKKTAGELKEIARSNAKNGFTPDKVYPKAPLQDCDEPNNDFDLSELYSSRANYTAQQKLDAVTAYVMTGTVDGAVRLTGLKQPLISTWKNKSSWWPDAYKAVKLQKQEEMDGVMTTIIHKAAEEVLERLVNGDEVITKDGERVRKRVSAKEASWIMAITHDKRALLRGDPTSRTEKVDTNKAIEELKENFEAMAREALEATVVKTLPTEEEPVDA